MRSFTFRGALLKGTVSSLLINLWQQEKGAYLKIPGTLSALSIVAFGFLALASYWSSVRYANTTSSSVISAIICVASSLMFVIISLHRLIVNYVSLQRCHQLQRTVHLRISFFNEHDLKNQTHTAMMSKINEVLYRERINDRGKKHKLARVGVKSLFDLLGLFNLRKHNDVRSYYEEGDRSLSPSD